MRESKQHQRWVLWSRFKDSITNNIVGQCDDYSNEHYYTICMYHQLLGSIYNLY